MRSPKGSTLLVCLAAAAGTALAEESPKTPLPGGSIPMIVHAWEVYAGVKGILLRSAENMPEKGYGFRPADSVRTYGRIVGHVADAQYFFCSLALGETNPSPKTVTLFGGETPKLGALDVNSLHSVEHYGNLVTYMRMKGIVPPTSEPAFQPGVKKRGGWRSTAFSLSRWEPGAVRLRK